MSALSKPPQLLCNASRQIVPAKAGGNDSSTVCALSLPPARFREVRRAWPSSVNTAKFCPGKTFVKFIWP